MKKTRMPQRLLALVLVLMMLISVLPVSAMAAELTPGRRPDRADGHRCDQ